MATQEKIDVCAYSRVSAAEVVSLIQWAAAALERQEQIWRTSENLQDRRQERAALLATARTLLWHE